LNKLLQLQCRLQAAIIANTIRERQGLAPAYGEEAFEQIADEAEALNNDRELLLLKLRAAIVEKEAIIADANADIANVGSWRCDYSIGMVQMSNEIRELVDLLSGGKQ